MMTLVKLAKRESPPAFLAAIFQLAWISPARTTRASAPTGTRRSDAPADGGGGHQVLEQRERDLARDGIGIELRLLGILQQDRVIDLGHVHLAHAPAAEPALADLFVVQQRDVLVADVLLDVAE